MSRRAYLHATALAAFVFSHVAAFGQTVQSTEQATRQISPATADDLQGREECRWSGKRVVTLLWRDDINGAREQLRFYDRFLCPDIRLRASFRCVIRSGEFDPQNPESVAAKVDQCWSNPDWQPESPAVAPPAEKPAAQ